jgi:hypothetical protein
MADEKEEIAGFAGMVERAGFTALLGKSKGTPGFVKRIKEYEATTSYLENKALKTIGRYKPDKDAIEFNPVHPSFPNTMEGRTAFRAHELIHRMDHMVYRSWGNVEFLGAIGKEMARLDNVVDNVRGRDVSVFDMVLEDVRRMSREDRMAVHDILSALRGKNDGLRFGHRVEYWTSDKRRVPKEILANIGTLDVTEGKGLAVIKRYFTELFNAYKEMVK